MEKGLTVQEFSLQWNKRIFRIDSNPHSHLVHSIFREILTQKKVDQGVIFIIQLAMDYEHGRTFLRGYVEGRFGSSDAEVKKFKRGLRLIQASKVIPIQAAKMIGGILEGAKIDSKTNTEKTKQLAQETNNPGQFLKALVLLDLRSTTRPTIYLESSFICLLANHFRRSTSNSKPNFSLVERIVRAIFGGKKKTVRLLGQLERNFNTRFPNWSKIAEQISKDGAKAKFVVLSSQ